MAAVGEELRGGFVSVLGCEQETTAVTATLQIEGTESRLTIPEVEDDATRHGEEATTAAAGRQLAAVSRRPRHRVCQIGFA